MVVAENEENIYLCCGDSSFIAVLNSKPVSSRKACGCVQRRIRPDEFKLLLDLDIYSS